MLGAGVYNAGKDGMEERGTVDVMVMVMMMVMVMVIMMMVMMIMMILYQAITYGTSDDQ